MSEPITVLIIDNHPSVRSGLRALLQTVPALQVIGDARDGESAVALALAKKPQVVIMELRRNGIGLLRAVLRASPDSKILVLTDIDNTRQIIRAFQAGARGYLIKDPLSADIAKAILDIMAGKFVLHHGLAIRLQENWNADQVAEGTADITTFFPQLELKGNYYSSSNLAIP